MNTTIRRYSLWLCALLVAIGVSGRRPGKAYVLPLGDIAALLPFTAAQSQAFKEKGVTRVDVTKDKSDYLTVHLLNTDGRVIRTEHRVSTDKEQIAHDVCTYRYDSAGRLVAMRYTDMYSETLDSMAYDLNGRLIYYLSNMTEHENKRGPRVVTVFHEQRILYSTASGNVLGDYTEHDSATVALDAKNRLMRMDGQGYTDSISVRADSSGIEVRQWWYREDTTAFRLGREEVSEGGRVITEATWELLYDLPEPSTKTIYTYDDAQRLMRKEHANVYQPKEFFTYYDFGFLMEHVTLGGNDVQVERYRYWLE